MKRINFLLGAPVLLLGLTCGDTGVTPREEPTNEDAIYNIIRYDRPSEFNLDLFDLSIPDTLAPLTGLIVPTHYWYHVQKDSLFIGIDIRYVQENDPLGTNPTADVFVRKYFWGTFEIIGVDTSGGQNLQVRMSKPFTIVGNIVATFEKFGFDYNRRRGWLLTGISDAIFDGGYADPIQSISIHTESGQDYIVDTNIKNLTDIIQFDPADSIIVTVRPSAVGDHVNLIYESSDSLITIHMPIYGPGQYTAGFRLSGSPAYGHFLVDVIPDNVLTDTTSFKSGAMGVIYRIK